MRALDYTVWMLGTVHEMHIIVQLLHAPCSFEQLTAAGSSHSMHELTVCLTQLEQRGVVERPEAVYQLTPTGKSLQPIFQAIAEQTQPPLTKAGFYLVATSVNSHGMFSPFHPRCSSSCTSVKPLLMTVFTISLIV